MKLLHVVNIALVVALLGFSVLVYGDLPERVPMHYAVDGTPDGWVTRTWFNWLIVPLIGVGVAALLYAVGALAPLKPSIVNIPNKKQLLELPLPLQRWVLAGLSVSMYASATVLLLMFVLLQYGAYRAALHGDSRYEILGGVLFGVIALPLTSLSSLFIIPSRLKRARHEMMTGKTRASSG